MGRVTRFKVTWLACFERRYAHLFDDEEIDFNNCNEFQIDCVFENVKVKV